MVCLVYLVYMQITEYGKREAYLQMHCFVTLLTAKTTKLVIPGLPRLCGLHANHCMINILFSALIFFFNQPEWSSWSVWSLCSPCKSHSMDKSEGGV